NVAAIWRHPEPVIQLRVLHAVLPRMRRIGFLASKDTAPLLPTLRAEATALGLELVVGSTDGGEALPVRLADVLSRSDALLALPDRSEERRVGKECGTLYVHSRSREE